MQTYSHKTTEGFQGWRSSIIQETHKAITQSKISSSLSRFGLYILRRIAIILLTIILGIYLTVTIANDGGQIDYRVAQGVTQKIREMEMQGWLADIPWEEREPYIEEMRVQLSEAAGLNLPLPLRNLRWTFNALTFQGGNVIFQTVRTLYGPSYELYSINRIILQHLPNTLMLIGTADLIIFLFGIPLALYLAARKRDRWLDRFISILSPLSSVPSWVYGILLVAIFSVGLHWLPAGGQFDNLPPANKWGYIPIVLKHMILPVTAILLGLFFQLVYTWRTYFVIYSEEDYVDLALAKGLRPKLIEKRYILRPTLPYLLTSFAITLVGFWQMTTALEYFFNWPGIGWLYINTLPNFWGEIFFPGEMGIILGLVVIFAYLLGLLVLILDIAYAWLDPRVRLGSSQAALRVVARTLKPRWRLRWRVKAASTLKSQASRGQASHPRIRLSNRRARRQRATGLGHLWREIRRYPSAMFGLTIITLFCIGSLYAIIAMPYAEIGSEWYATSLTGRAYQPKNALPAWTNYFRKDDWPTTMLLRSQDGSIQKTIQTPEDGSPEIVFEATFEYPYRVFPQDLLLHIEPVFQEKRPHLTITWITPDGREFSPRSPSIEGSTSYSFSENLIVRRLLRQNEHWEKWFVVEEPNNTPEFYLLFADPAADSPLALPGRYQLKISALTFEESADVDIELVVLGRVAGLAGTDYLRRDLLIPLLWGLPLALAFGAFGAVLTTILAMIIAAASVWFGGWVDALIQRITEANMILPILAVGILVYALYGVNLWVILGVVILLTVFGNPTKAFRAAFIQVKAAPYIEASQAYGASNARIILRYMIPRILPVLIPQLVTLIPSLVFLEATLAIFNVYDPHFPTWGRVIFDAVSQNALYGGYSYWVLEPIGLLLLTGLAFALLGFALERILNPRLQEK